MRSNSGICELFVVFVGEDDDEEDDEEDEDSEVGNQEEEESDSVGDDKKDNGDEETEDDEEGAEDEDIETEDDEDDEDIEKFKEQLKLKAGTDKEFRYIPQMIGTECGILYYGSPVLSDSGGTIDCKLEEDHLLTEFSQN